MLLFHEQNSMAARNRRPRFESEPHARPRFQDGHPLRNARPEDDAVVLKPSPQGAGQEASEPPRAETMSHAASISVSEPASMGLAIQRARKRPLNLVGLSSARCVKDELIVDVTNANIYNVLEQNHRLKPHML